MSGPDLSLIVLLPVLICLISGGVPSIAFPIQLTLTWLAFLWGTHVRKPKSAKDGGLFGTPRQRLASSTRLESIPEDAAPVSSGQAGGTWQQFIAARHCRLCVPTHTVYYC
ncbi:hypothetical protein NHF46_06300 [Arthrobacter alpinus]|nr:hypothetical protein [Arthrobacter alpinus]